MAVLLQVRPPALPRPPECFLFLPTLPPPQLTEPLSFLIFLSLDVICLWQNIILNKYSTILTLAAPTNSPTVGSEAQKMIKIYETIALCFSRLFVRIDPSLRHLYGFCPSCLCSCNDPRSALSISSTSTPLLGIKSSISQNAACCPSPFSFYPHTHLRNQPPPFCHDITRNQKQHLTPLRSFLSRRRSHCHWCSCTCCLYRYWLFCFVRIDIFYEAFCQIIQGRRISLRCLSTLSDHEF